MPGVSMRRGTTCKVERKGEERERETRGEQSIEKRGLYERLENVAAGVGPSIDNAHFVRGESISLRKGKNGSGQKRPRRCPRGTFARKSEEVEIAQCQRFWVPLLMVEWKKAAGRFDRSTHLMCCTMLT